MAATIVMSTLMVLLSESGDDFQLLWEQTGSVNDPSANKHSMTLSDVISGGNFRSSKIDNWAAEDFDSIYLSGYNEYGDLLWETEFNCSGTTNVLTSWLNRNQFIGTSSSATEPQNSMFSSDNYRVQLDSYTDADKSWFAISVHDMTYQPLPLMFAARSQNQPFTLPPLIEGRLGCWQSTQMTDWTFGYSDMSGMKPDDCVTHCNQGFNTAVLVFASDCYCANHDPNNLPTDQSSFCYRPCPGDGAVTCGGFTTTDGDAYYVQNGKPGAVDEVQIFTDFKALTNNVQIDITDIYGSVDEMAHVTFITVFTYITSSQTFTIQYKPDVCSSSTTFKTFGDPAHVYPVTSSNVTLNILPFRCIRFQFSNWILDVTVRLYGVPQSSEHIEVPVVAVIAKKTIPVTTSTAAPNTTSTVAPTTTSSTTTTPQSTTTPQPTTITTTQQPTTTQNLTTTANITTTPPTSTTTTSSTSSSTSTPMTSSVTSSTPTTSVTTTLSSSTTVTTTPSTSTIPSTTLTSSTTITSVTTLSTALSTTTQAPSTTNQSTIATTLAGQSTTALTPTTTTTAPVCYCPCDTVPQQENLTAQELQAKIATIQKKLAVNVSELSSTIRRLTSAEDSRPSAVGIGYLGVGFLVGMFGSIILIDSGMIVKDMKQLWDNLKQGCKG